MRLLDLCCGAGGAGKGYADAGWEVEGVDIAPQPRYPFIFHQADALSYLAEHWFEFDAVHGSPPCQRYSRMSVCRPGLAQEYPSLVLAFRAAFRELPVPTVMENVKSDAVRPDLTLCGTMFGLKLYRHRVFELSFPVSRPLHPQHSAPGGRAGRWRKGQVISVVGHSRAEPSRQAMGIDWMRRDELSEAIPPKYTQFIGSQLKNALERA